jgi:hypothetical protein
LPLVLAMVITPLRLYPALLELSKNPLVDVAEANEDESRRDEPEVYPVVSMPPASPSLTSTLTAPLVLIPFRHRVIRLTQEGMLVKVTKDVLAAFWLVIRVMGWLNLAGVITPLSTVQLAPDEATVMSPLSPSVRVTMVRYSMSVAPEFTNSALSPLLVRDGNRFTLAAAAVLAPVPPSAMAMSVMPVIEPPVMATLVVACDALARGMPPAVAPSWTTIVSLVVSTVISASNPVKLECWTVVPLRSRNAFAIVIPLLVPVYYPPQPKP